MKSLFVLFLMNFLLSNALAWSERGNGGNSIICKDSTKNQFFDAFEAEFRHQFTIDHPSVHEKCIDANPEKCLEQAINIAYSILDRIRVDNPAQEYFKSFAMQTLQDFPSEARFLSGIVIMPINDFGSAFVPKGCRIEQTVLQKPPLFPSGTRYIISSDIWNLLSPFHQAVGIVHEILYAYAISQGMEVKDSEGIRYFNALLFSNELLKLDPIEYNYKFSYCFKR